MKSEHVKELGGFIGCIAGWPMKTLLGCSLSWLFANFLSPVIAIYPESWTGHFGGFSTRLASVPEGCSSSQLLDRSSPQRGTDTENETQRGVPVRNERRAGAFSEERAAELLLPGDEPEPAEDRSKSPSLLKSESMKTSRA